MKQKTKNLLENGFRIVTEIGCAKAVSSTVLAFVPSNVSIPMKICTQVGASMLGAAVGEYAADWAIQEAHYIKRAYEDGELVAIIIR